MKKNLKSRLKNPHYEMTLEEFLVTSNASMPDELLLFIISWKSIKKSPYNNTSYYNGPKSWDSFIDEGIRVSDHWNFSTSSDLFKVHCKTTTPVENNANWYVGIYDAKSDTYNIIRKFPILKRERSLVIGKRLSEIKSNFKPSDEEIERRREIKRKNKIGKLILTLVNQRNHRSTERNFRTSLLDVGDRKIVNTTEDATRTGLEGKQLEDSRVEAKRQMMI
jgi:hypothetical protein